MRALVVSVLVLLLYLMGSPALARQHPERTVMHHRTGIKSVEYKNRPSRIVTVDTAAGPIRVAADYATRFKNLIADFVAAGYNPGHVGCFATGGHVRHSRHYLGQACDFDQGARPHSAFMRSAAADKIISRYGFTNGCSFSDCGHVGTDNIGYAHHGHRHYAHHYRHRHGHVKIACAPGVLALPAWNKPTGQA